MIRTTKAPAQSCTGAGQDRIAGTAGNRAAIMHDHSTPLLTTSIFPDVPMDLAWTKEAHDILNALEDTDNHYLLTGNAGTGKTTLMRHWIHTTRKTVAVVAPTGIAALNIKGETLHRFCHMAPNTLPERMRKLPEEAQKLYKKLDAIVIDEISMVRADILDCLHRFLQQNGPRPRQPFGGLQVIMVGDLGQLQPVVTREEHDIFHGQMYDSAYFFAAKAWRSASFHMLRLTHNYRQHDGDFCAMLDRIRDGAMHADNLAWLNRHTVGPHPASHTAITLTMTNAQAKAINDRHLTALHGREQIFIGLREGDMPQLPTEEVLTLKIDARVMLIANDPAKRWVNGTTGRICALPRDASPLVELDSGQRCTIEPFTWKQQRYVLENGELCTRTLGSFQQLPLRLAWASTVHKVQGLTLDAVTIDWGRGAFANGQAYVALSRCRSFAGLRQTRPLRLRDIRADPVVQTFYQFLLTNGGVYGASMGDRRVCHASMG